MFKNYLNCHRHFSKEYTKEQKFKKITGKK